MVKKYRSEAFASIHETMDALHDVGAIDKQTMREFDDACLTPIHVLTPEEIKAIRTRERISQPVFAHYLNVQRILSQTGNVASRSQAALHYGCLP